MGRSYNEAITDTLSHHGKTIKSLGLSVEVKAKEVVAKTASEYQGTSYIYLYKNEFEKSTLAIEIMDKGWTSPAERKLYTWSPSGKEPLEKRHKSEYDSYKVFVSELVEVPAVKEEEPAPWIMDEMPEEDEVPTVLRKPFEKISVGDFMAIVWKDPTVATDKNLVTIIKNKFDK